MTIPRSPAKLILLFVLGSLPVAIVACAYDWTLGATAQPPDGGAPDGASRDAALDATTDARLDASGTPDGGPDADSATTDASPSCAALETNLDNARALAQKCTPYTTQCEVPVTNECGCRNYVADAGSPAANAFTQALAALYDSGCTPACDASTCVPTGGACYPARSLCYP
jgi:hypothetical protein